MCAKEEGMGEIAEASKVVDGEWQESSNMVGIEVGNKECNVNVC